MTVCLDANVIINGMMRPPFIRRSGNNEMRVGIREDDKITEAVGNSHVGRDTLFCHRLATK